MSFDKMKPSVAKRLKSKKPKGDDSLWKLLDDKRQEGNEARRPYERQWLLNLAFLSGKQYAYYNQNAERLQHVRTQKGRVRLVDNKIISRFRKQVARLLRADPIVTVIPASSSAEDIRAAKVGSRVLKYFWRQDRMRARRRLLANWMFAAGNAFLEDKWNPKLGPITIDDNGDARYLGDAECAIWSPFEVGVPAHGLCSSTLEEMPWITLSKFLDLEAIRTNYPKRGKEVLPETSPTPITDASTLFGLQTSGAEHKQEGAIVTLLRMKPNSAYPKGLYVVGANGIILEHGDYPFESYHLQQFKDIEIPGLFYGMATTEGAIWPQKLHNRTLSDIAEHNRVMARGKWLSPRKARMETKFDDTIGQHIVYDPVMGAKPEQMTLKGLPNSYILALQTVAQSFMELYSQHEVSQGTNKSDIRSGGMVQLLLEQDAEGVLPTHALFEEGLREVMLRILKRIKSGYTTERIIAISDEPPEEAFTFKGLDLRDSKDIIVARESSLSESKAGRQAQILERFGQGLYGHPQESGTRERILRMLEEVPDTIQDIYGETHLDRQNARMENSAIMEDPQAQILVNAYDNHIIHLKEHHLARKQPEHQRLRLTTPQLFWIREAGFMQHEVQHQTFIEQQRQQMLEEMTIQKGSGK